MVTGLEKITFHSSPKEGSCQRMFGYSRIVHIQQASKVMLKILQAMIQQYMNWELLDIQARFRKHRRTRDQVANIHLISREQGNSGGVCMCVCVCVCVYMYVYICIYISASLITRKLLIVWSQQTGKFLKRWGKVLTLLVSWETCIQVKKKQNQTWNNRLVQNWKRS